LWGWMRGQSVLILTCETPDARALSNALMRAEDEAETDL